MPQYKDDSRGTWFCKFAYTDWTGQRRQKLKRGFPTKREAAAWERDFLEKQQDTPDMSFKALVGLYLEDIQPRIKDSSLVTKQGLINLWLLPYFGDTPINEITPATVRKWQAVISTPADGKAPTKRHLYNIESQFVSIMGFAVKYYHLPSNPHNAAGYIGNTQSPKMQYWTKSEFDKFLAVIKDLMLRVIFEILFYAGLRIGELLALNLEDVNFDQCSITVSKTYSERGGKKQITPPKTWNSNRVVMIPAFLRDHIQEYARLIYGLTPSDRLFPVSSCYIRRAMIKGSAAAGVKKIRIHDIRHSHVSLLIDLGFTPHLIAERIGDTVDMVNNVYGHLYPSRHVEVAERLQQCYEN